MKYRPEIQKLIENIQINSPLAIGAAPIPRLAARPTSAVVALMGTEADGVLWSDMGDYGIKVWTKLHPDS